MLTRGGVIAAVVFGRHADGEHAAVAKVVDHHRRTADLVWHGRTCPYADADLLVIVSDPATDVIALAQVQAVYRHALDGLTRHHIGRDYRLHSAAARSFAGRLAAQLPLLPVPWDIDRLCRDLSEQRGRTLTVHEVNMPTGVTGLWFDDGTCDHILVHAPTRGIYRDHIILHEIAHMLAGHGSHFHADAACDVVDHYRHARIDIEELIAEQFATIILHRVHRSVHYTTPLEHRAADVFGATNA